MSLGCSNGWRCIGRWPSDAPIETHHQLWTLASLSVSAFYSEAWSGCIILDMRLKSFGGSYHLFLLQPQSVAVSFGSSCNLFNGFPNHYQLHNDIMAGFGPNNLVGAQVDHCKFRWADDPLTHLAFPTLRLYSMGMRLEATS